MDCLFSNFGNELKTAFTFVQVIIVQVIIVLIFW